MASCVFISFNKRRDLLFLSLLSCRGDKPPKDLVREFESEGLSDQSSEECKLRWEQFDLELQRFDDVDPAKIEDYKEAKKQVASLEHELSRWEVSYYWVVSVTKGLKYKFSCR